MANTATARRSRERMYVCVSVRARGGTGGTMSLAGNNEARDVTLS